MIRVSVRRAGRATVAADVEAQGPLGGQRVFF